MVEERYPGECRVLRHFLAELEPVALSILGQDAMLFHAIRRALVSNALVDMQRARRLFNVLPRELKQRLSEGLVERSAARRPKTRSLERPDAATRPGEPPGRVMERLTDCGIYVRLVPRQRTIQPR